MTRLLKIALLHLAPELGALDENRALIESGTRLAAGLGTEWVLSGELVVPGYRFAELIGTEWIGEQPDLWLRRLSQLSAELGVVSFVSHPERGAASGQLFNSLFVIGRNGRMLGRHRKLHPTPGSEGWAAGGELGPPVLVEGIQVGLLVCADAYPRQPAYACRTPARSCSSRQPPGGPVSGARTASGKRGRWTRGCRWSSATAPGTTASRR
jgi:predicted amidohydrolase